MAISLVESQAIQEMSELLYDFLPGKPHPYSDSTISFEGVAHEVGLSDFWHGGSKKPSIAQLLELTLEHKRSHFSKLILQIVRKGMTYRNNKKNPITKEEILQLNELIKKVQFKIPDLWHPEFLESLPSQAKSKIAEPNIVLPNQLQELADELTSLSNLSAQTRGYMFEKILQQLFAMYNLNPRTPFRLVGEQIDGSFELDNSFYLVEAKWHSQPISQSDLLVFQGRVEAKSAWTRGLFISFSGFTEEGIEAFSKGRSTKIIGMDGRDLFFVLTGQIEFPTLLKRKLRSAAETGAFFISAFELSRNTPS